ncbi:MAG: calcium-binding protein, partial [Pseudomonadota bacterium]
KLVYNGTAGNDTLTGLLDAPNIINGGAGNDTLTGGGQADLLNGGDGMDLITAGSGNASLTGGTGNDTLNAGRGVDTFVFNQGAGQDVINEMYIFNKTGDKNLDVLKLGTGLLASATQVTRGVGAAANDLTLMFGGADQITLTNYFSSDFRLQTIQFADGTKWDYATVAGKLVYNGTAGNDTLTGAGILDVLQLDTVLQSSPTTGLRGIDAVDVVLASHGMQSSELLFKTMANGPFATIAVREQALLQEWYPGPDNSGMDNPNLLIGSRIYFQDQSQSQSHGAQLALSNWTLSASLLNFHLGGSDAMSIEGDLTEQYVKSSNLSTCSMSAVPAELAIHTLGAGSHKRSSTTLMANLFPA